MHGVNLIDFQVEHLRDTPAVSPTAFHDCPKPQFWTGLNELLILPIFQESLSDIVFSQARKRRNTEHLRGSCFCTQAKHALEGSQFAVYSRVLCVFLLPCVN